MEEELIEKPVKPGQYLVYEREKRGFTVEDIAAQLHLSSQIIRALEEDDYGQLPEQVYVRGYIRSYCRLLRIDPTSALDLYAASLPQEENYLLADLAANPSVNEHHQRMIIVWGSIALITIFLMLIISWWQEKQLTTIILNKPVAVQNDQNKNTNIFNSSEVPSPDLEQEISRHESDNEAELEDIASPPILEPVEIEIKEAIQEDGVADESEPTPVDSNRTDDGETGTVPQRVTLVVMASGESWARIRDGSGEIIIHRILPPDYSKIFKVSLPLKFEFGNAYQTSIMIDGKEYNFSSYIRPSRAATFEVTELP